MPDLYGGEKEKVKIYAFEVQTIKTGQERRYGDTVNEFIVKNKTELSSFPDHNDRLVERFCKAFVAAPVRFKDSPCHFDSKETFKKIDDVTYSYKQVIPSTH